MIRPRRLLAAFAAALLVSLLLAGCGGGDDQGTASGEDLYKRNCATCHGSEGHGGIGADLRGVADRLTPEEHIRTVTEGRAPMPAFGGQLSDEQIRMVVQYEREVLSPG